MKSAAFTALFLLAVFAGQLSPQPVPIDTTVITAEGDTVRFWAQIPAQYSAVQPPAILIWWHQLGGTQYEMRDWTSFPSLANERGWIAASHFGPNDRHWNAREGQKHCRVMLDWLMERYPFCRDSIYMVGGSMGGAAGQVWHNNNCGLSDYFEAANAGGSQILDCQLRQEQYLADGDTNRSMRAVFGGVPGDPDSAVYLFEYHRYSAVYFRDTTQSMHFNSLHLPVYNTWGSTPFEWFAYGYEAQAWDTLRMNGGADTTFCDSSGIAGHGFGVLTQDSVVRWLSGFCANRYPTNLSINADEDDEYYWTRVQLFNTAHTFGRYGVTRNFENRRLDINLVRNIAAIEIEFAFPWPHFDSLSGIWMNHDSATIAEFGVAFSNIPEVLAIRGPGGSNIPFQYADRTMTAQIAHSGAYTVIFEPTSAGPRQALLPEEWRIVSASPNPFNSQVALEIEGREFARREIRIYDITGRIAKSLCVTFSPGTQRVILSGDGLSSGIYFAVLENAGQPPVKLVLLK